MSEETPIIEPSNASTSIAVAAAEALGQYLEGCKEPGSHDQLVNVHTVIRALDVQDMLLVRLEEICDDSGKMIRQTRVPHIQGIAWSTVQLSLLAYLLAFATVFLRALMLRFLWLWFAVSLGAPDIHYSGAIGLAILFQVVVSPSGHRIRSFWAPERRDVHLAQMRQLFVDLAQSVFWQLLLFGVAFFVHLAAA